MFYSPYKIERTANKTVGFNGLNKKSQKKKLMLVFTVLDKISNKLTSMDIASILCGIGFLLFICYLATKLDEPID